MGASDYRLIELIRQNKFLYDHSHHDFQNLEKKEITWRAIAAAQGSTPEICRRRFRGLRDRFAREKRQNGQQLLDGSATNPIWLKMMFLWDHLKTHRRFQWNRPRHKTSDLEGYASSGPGEADSSHSTLEHTEDERLAVEQMQRLADMEEQDAGQSSQVEGQSVADPTIVQESAETPTRRTRKYRPIRPKPDTSSSQRNNPIIVNLTPRESKDISDNGPGKSEADSDGCEELEESVEKPRGPRGSSSTTTAGHSSQTSDLGDGPSSQITCNDAFCLMLQDSLDQVTNPLKLSLLRIKILTILHNEVYG